MRSRRSAQTWRRISSVLYSEWIDFWLLIKRGIIISGVQKMCEGLRIRNEIMLVQLLRPELVRLYTCQKATSWDHRTSLVLGVTGSETPTVAKCGAHAIVVSFFYIISVCLCFNAHAAFWSCSKDSRAIHIKWKNGNFSIPWARWRTGKEPVCV